MTVESALVLSVLVAFTMALVWGLLVVAAQIQCLDAARTGARAAARQDPAEKVLEVTRQAAPRGARVTVGRTGDQVRVTVVARPPVLTGLPFEVREEAVAAAEEAVGAASPGLGPGPGSDPGPATPPGPAREPVKGSATGAGTREEGP